MTIQHPDFISAGTPFLGENRICFSSLHAFEGNRKVAQHFSIKQVMKGTEHYRVNGKPYPVHAGQFLLTNTSQQYDCLINSREPVLGMCLFLSGGLIGEVYEVLAGNTTRLLDDPFVTPDRHFSFNTAVYNNGADGLGHFLSGLAAGVDIHTGQLHSPPETIFYSIAEKLLIAQRHLFAQVSRVKALLPATRKELFNRVNIARNLIEQQFDQPLRLASLAQAAHLSPFHFLRTFRQVFGLSPHQYLLRKRLQQASGMLLTGHHAIAEIAQACGFSDIHAFSKSFRKAYGLAPSKYGKRMLQHKTTD